MKLYYATRTICPICHELVPGRVLARDGKVYITRRCPEHGEQTGLTCSDVAWYEQLPRFETEGIAPKTPKTGEHRTCPEGCGLCPQHAQIAGTAAIEISNDCNAACPVCLADNQQSFQLTVDEVSRAADVILRSQETVGVVTLSGGEPTIHPELFKILEVLDRPRIERIGINTNGLRVAEDEAFVTRLAEHEKIYLCMHYDGENAAVLRGIDHDTQVRAIDRLRDHGIGVVPLVLSAQGVNDHELGPIVEHLLRDYPNVKSVHCSMMTYTGRGGADFPGDPMTRLTIPEALERIEESSAGRLKKRDFMPLTMPNPMCAAIGFYLLMDGELTPLLPLADLDRVIACTKDGHFGTVNSDFEQLLRDTIDTIYAHPERFEQAELLLSKFRRLVQAVFAPGADHATRLRAAEAHIKSVLLLQFMDAWTFDSRRLRKCSCQHVFPDGRITSSCGYYAYHRRRDPRFLQ